MAVDSSLPVSFTSPAAIAAPENSAAGFRTTVSASPRGTLSAMDSFSLQSAAEEIGGFFSEKAESGIKEQALEEYRPPQVPSQSHLDAVARVLFDLEQLARMKSFAQSLARGDVSLKFAQDSFADPTQQYLLVATSVHIAREQPGAPEVSARLYRAIDDLTNAHGPSIHSDLNTMEVAAAFSADKERVGNFRKLYRETISGKYDCSKMFTRILDRFGSSGFDDGIDLLLKALKLDLAAQAPSSEPEKISAVMKDIQLIQVVRTSMEACRKASNDIERNLQCAVNPIAFAKKILDFLSKDFYLPGTIAAWPKDFGIEAEDDKTYFMEYVFKLVNMIHDRAFNLETGREKAVGAVLENLDGLILGDSN